MLFLGAGASKAVEIGDLHELTNKINVQLEKKGYKNLIEDVTDILKNANQDNRFFGQNEIDIEVIFSVLNGLADPVKALKDLGPYAIYVNELGRNQKSKSLQSPSLQKRQIDRIRSIVGQVIASSCNKFNTAKATTFYHDLFEFEKETFKRGRQRLFSHTVTTNYDLVFERCASKNSDMPASTGFRRDVYLPLQKIVLEDQFHDIEYVKPSHETSEEFLCYCEKLSQDDRFMKMVEQIYQNRHKGFERGYEMLTNNS